MRSYLILEKHSKNHLQNCSLIHLLHVKEIKTVVVAMVKADLQTQQSSFSLDRAEKVELACLYTKKKIEGTISACKGCLTSPGPANRF